MSKQPSIAEKSSDKNVDSQRCGIVMPISSIDGCSELHWSEVKAILFDAIEAAGFAPHMVSDADDIGIIQGRIIQNLYENPLVVCDVSGKNPNVMFELGMRLAFDKPTIIVKDDKTTYSFDVAQIEHVEYPRDLRFSKVVQFKQALAEKVKGTYARARDDKNYTTFLKHFGKFSVAKLETREVSKEEFIIQELQDLRRIIVHNSDIVRSKVAVDHDSPTSRRLRYQSAKNVILSHLAALPKELLDSPNGEELALSMLRERIDLPDIVKYPVDYRELVRQCYAELLASRRD